MTINLVTGKTGKPHVGSDDDGALRAGIVGPDSYILSQDPLPELVMKDSNTATVPKMQGLFEGRHFRITAAEDVKLDSGTQGMKRNDILAVHYEKDTEGIESVALKIIKGTPSATTAADPALSTGSILEGASAADMPLWRIPLENVSVGTPVPLFNVIAPMSELWDSVTPTPETTDVVFGWSNSKFTLVKENGVVTTGGQMSLVSDIHSCTNKDLSQTIPAGFRPVDKGAILLIANNGQTQEYAVGPDGKMTISTSNASVGYFFTYSGAWIAE